MITRFEWFSWEDRFNVAYLPTKPAFHATFIAISYDEEIRLGLGSANPTRSGWEKNSASWDWDKTTEFSNVSATLEDLIKRKLIDTNDVRPWLDDLKRTVRKPSSVSWLLPGKKKDVLSDVLGILKAKVSKPTLLRILSPYYDKGSAVLARDFLRGLGLDNHAIEIWADRSGIHTQGSHVANLISLCENLGVSSIRYPVRVVPKSATIRDERPLHAKLIEVIGQDGAGVRILGSANFTAAAWKGSNLSPSRREVRKGQDFVGLLPAGRIRHKEQSNFSGNIEEGAREQQGS